MKVLFLCLLVSLRCRTGVKMIPFINKCDVIYHCLDESDEDPEYAGCEGRFKIMIYCHGVKSHIVTWANYCVLE